MATETVRRATEIASNISRRCDHCNEMVGGGLGDGSVADSINHFITAHGYRLLHVGSQTNHGPNGEPWHNVVAVMGHDNPPPVQPPARVEIRSMPERT
jgi:hypothetical protein